MTSALIDTGTMAGEPASTMAARSSALVNEQQWSDCHEHRCFVQNSKRMGWEEEWEVARAMVMAVEMRCTLSLMP